jgi:RNA polymerase sigma-54 factor
VEKEDKQNPLSDEEIVDKLQAMGLNVARRTVTKYRKALKIPSSRQRREY